MVQRREMLETDTDNRTKHLNVHRNGTKSFFSQRESHLRMQERKERAVAQVSSELGSTSTNGDANVEVLDPRHARGFVNELEPAEHQLELAPAAPQQEQSDLTKRIVNIERRVEKLEEKYEKMEAHNEAIKSRFHSYEIKLAAFARMMVTFPAGSQSDQPGPSST
ncbi:hypothetical protein Syun_016092 [Stephania yunnanensis]|uniref:Uncharacterized protein n=1 Tax=Stephania yunnanensis TaxID=152371 RepID=A0AAP0J5A3_9MAGN